MYKICFIILAIAVIYTAAAPSEQNSCSGLCARDCKINGYYKGGYCPDGKNCICREPQGTIIEYVDNTCQEHCSFDCRQASNKGGYCVNTTKCVCIPRY